MRHWIEKKGQLGETSGLQSYKAAEEKKRADEIHMSKIQAEEDEKKRAVEIKILIARIEADKDLTLKEMELKA